MTDGQTDGHVAKTRASIANSDPQIRCHSLYSLPDSVVESKSINSFKNNLDKFWQNEDVKFKWKANLTGAGSRSLSLM